MATLSDYINEMATVADETFICQECGHTLPIEFRHAEKPEVCFLDYVSEKDAAEIKRIIAEVLAEG